MKSVPVLVQLHMSVSYWSIDCGDAVYFLPMSLQLHLLQCFEHVSTTTVDSPCGRRFQSLRCNVLSWGVGVLRFVKDSSCM